jgi:hypothetical protein
MMKPLAPKPPKEEEEESDKEKQEKKKYPKDISSKKVSETLGTIHGNLASTLKSKKFRNAFSLNYGPIQKAVGKRMDKVGKDENDTQKVLDKTKVGIDKLKKDKGSGLFGMLFGGIGGILVTIAGALILISLARIGL